MPSDAKRITVYNTNYHDAGGLTANDPLLPAQVESMRQALSQSASVKGLTESFLNAVVNQLVSAVLTAESIEDSVEKEDIRVAVKTEIKKLLQDQTLLTQAHAAIESFFHQQGLRAVLNQHGEPQEHIPQADLPQAAVVPFFEALKTFLSAEGDAGEELTLARKQLMLKQIDTITQTWQRDLLIDLAKVHYTQLIKDFPSRTPFVCHPHWTQAIIQQWFEMRWGHYTQSDSFGNSSFSMMYTQRFAQLHAWREPSIKNTTMSAPYLSNEGQARSFSISFNPDNANDWVIFINHNPSGRLDERSVQIFRGPECSLITPDDLPFEEVVGDDPRTTLLGALGSETMGALLDPVFLPSGAINAAACRLLFAEGGLIRVDAEGFSAEEIAGLLPTAEATDGSVPDIAAQQLACFELKSAQVIQQMQATKPQAEQMVALQARVNECLEDYQLSTVTSEFTQVLELRKQLNKLIKEDGIEKLQQRLSTLEQKVETDPEFQTLEQEQQEKLRDEIKSITKEACALLAFRAALNSTLAIPGLDRRLQQRLIKLQSNTPQNPIFSYELRSNEQAEVLQATTKKMIAAVVTAKFEQHVQTYLTQQADEGHNVAQAQQFADALRENLGDFWGNNQQGIREFLLECLNTEKFTAITTDCDETTEEQINNILHFATAVDIGYQADAVEALWNLSEAERGIIRDFRTELDTTLEQVRTGELSHQNIESSLQQARNNLIPKLNELRPVGCKIVNAILNVLIAATIIGIVPLGLHWRKTHDVGFVIAKSAADGAISEMRPGLFKAARHIPTSPSASRTHSEVGSDDEAAATTTPSAA